jgi:hypothetical protein
MGAQDPRTKFKTSDYEKQEQELPGLQSSAPSLAYAIAAARPIAESPPVTSIL